MGVQDQRKEAAKAVTAARQGGGGSRGVIAAIAIVVVLVVVIGVSFWLLSKPQLPKEVPLAGSGPQYPVTVQDDTVVTGNPQAPVTIDIFEDFLCPSCGNFERAYHQRLAQAAAEGKAKVVYHPVAIVPDELSTPPGYSKRAAGAAFCAAEAGIFPRFHDSLYLTQPQEGGSAWTSANLQQLGRALGAGDGFARCMQTDATARVNAATERARSYISGLRADHRFGTPAVVVNGAVVDPSQEGWLDQALSAGALR